MCGNLPQMKWMSYKYLLSLVPEKIAGVCYGVSITKISTNVNNWLTIITTCMNAADGRKYVCREGGAAFAIIVLGAGTSGSGIDSSDRGDYLLPGRASVSAISGDSGGWRIRKKREICASGIKAKARGHDKGGLLCKL